LNLRRRILELRKLADSDDWWDREIAGFALRNMKRPQEPDHRALDAASINATDQNSNGCLNRFFGNIKGLLRLLFQCVTLAKPRWNPFAKRRRSDSKAAVVRLIARTSLVFLGIGFCCYQMRNIWCTLSWGSSTGECGNFLSTEGHMKNAIFFAALLTLNCFSLPIFAQQQDLQEVMNAANALSARESELLSKKDAAGIASLFTSDGLLVMLAPQFGFKPGRDAIQKYYQGIVDAGASNITLELKNLELRGNDGVWAAGNYSATVKDKTIQGN
jgi:ketosteroid isomerase-like protein